MESHSTVCKRRKRIQYIRSFVGLEMSDNETALKTALMKDCHYFREVIESFKFPFQTVRLLRLGIGAEIKPHGAKMKQHGVKWSQVKPRCAKLRKHEATLSHIE